MKTRGKATFILLFLALSLVNYLSALENSMSEKTPNLKGQFQVVLDELHDQYNFPGATAAFILPDESVEAFTVGLADKEYNIPMKTESRMLAASIGKTFVGAVVLSLCEEDLLQLDDPISKWLDNYLWFERLPNHNTITLRHLLTHSSGIPNHVEMESFASFFQEYEDINSKTFSPEKLIEFVLDEEPLFKAGNGWYYSDTGFILVGIIIEAATGNSYYEEVTKRFLKPLQLNLTSPSDCKELTGLAAGYQSTENNFNLPAKTVDNNGIMNWNPAIEWTGGGLISNPQDLVVWAKKLYEENAIEGDYLEDLLHSVPLYKSDPDTQYGIATAIKKETLGTTYGHSGWIPGCCSSLRYYPEYGVAISFQINTDIGIIDGSTELFNEMENRLAQVLIKSVNKNNTKK